MNGDKKLAVNTKIQKYGLPVFFVFFPIIALNFGNSLSVLVKLFKNNFKII